MGILSIDQPQKDCQGLPGFCQQKRHILDRPLWQFPCKYCKWPGSMHNVHQWMIVNGDECCWCFFWLRTDARTKTTKFFSMQQRLSCVQICCSKLTVDQRGIVGMPESTYLPSCLCESCCGYLCMCTILKNAQCTYSRCFIYGGTTFLYTTNLKVVFFNSAFIYIMTCRWLPDT